VDEDDLLGTHFVDVGAQGFPRGVSAEIELLDLAEQGCGGASGLSWHDVAMGREAEAARG